MQLEVNPIFIPLYTAMCFSMFLFLVFQKQGIKPVQIMYVLVLSMHIFMQLTHAAIYQTQLTEI